MDYGQTNQKGNMTPFFTEGVGNEPTDFGAFEKIATDPGLNLDPRANRSLGKNALNGAEGEYAPVQAEYSANAPTLGEIPNYGEITDYNPNMVAPTPVDTASDYNRSNIRTTGDFLDGRAIKEVEKAEAEFKKTGDAADFYTKARAMMTDNLDNSFNRKVGEN